MRAVVCAVVLAMLLPFGAAEARPRAPIVYEDPDDTAGPFDVLSVTRTRAKHWGARAYEHRVRFQERWEDDEVEATFLLSAHGFEAPPGAPTTTARATGRA